MSYGNFKGRRPNARYKLQLTFFHVISVILFYFIFIVLVYEYTYSCISYGAQICELSSILAFEIKG